MIDKKGCQDSKVFCMFPWLHLNVTPVGNVYPCCSSAYDDPIGNAKETNIEELFNCDRMKQLRLDMLAGKQSKICTFCYEHEKAGPYSFRTYANEHFFKYFDSYVTKTKEDGSVDEFNMHYFDVRFSNKCNFKCRTCGSEFSSTWAQEQRDLFFPDNPVLMQADDSGTLLDTVIDQIENIDIAYFAGGEPLIMNEHYVMLEDMIRKGHTNLTLRYNTNVSTLKYKEYDLLELWSHFPKIELSCSIDHFGEKAEYLRCGTNWETIERNLTMLQGIKHIDFQFNTVLSIFNYLTLTDLYKYLYEKNFIDEQSWHNTLYLAANPLEYCVRNLPAELKVEAERRALEFCTKYPNLPVTNLLKSGIAFANEADTWNEHKELFWTRTKELDAYRKQDLLSVFPELTYLEVL